jgi:hypothetical protein
LDFSNFSIFDFFDSIDAKREVAIRQLRGDMRTLALGSRAGKASRCPYFNVGRDIRYFCSLSGTDLSEHMSAATS